MAETVVPTSAIYAEEGLETRASARAAAEVEEGEAPTLLDARTLTSKGLVRVGKGRVPTGANKAPTEDAVRKGAKQPTSEPGFDLYYEQHGKGERKIVFLMGLNHSCFGWAPQVEHFAKDDRYSVIVLDNRGYGNSDTPSDYYSTSAMAQDVLELLDSPKIKWTKARQLHIVGVSMGGMIALELGKQVPQRIASISLLSTTSGLSPLHKPWEKSVLAGIPPLTGIRAVLRIIIGEALGLDSDEYRIQRMAATLFPLAWLEAKSTSDPKGRTNRVASADIFDLRFGYTRRPTVYGPLAQIGAVVTHRVSNAQLANINKDIPAITILTGDSDNLVNPHNSEHLAKHLKRATYIRFKDAGHVLPAQVPQKVNDAIARNIEQAVERLAQHSWS